jgi:hypothetical protein
MSTLLQSNLRQPQSRTAADTDRKIVLFDDRNGRDALTALGL